MRRRLRRKDVLIMAFDEAVFFIMNQPVKRRLFTGPMHQNWQKIVVTIPKLPRYFIIIAGQHPAEISMTSIETVSSPPRRWLESTIKRIFFNCAHTHGEADVTSPRNYSMQYQRSLPAILAFITIMIYFVKNTDVYRNKLTDCSDLQLVIHS